MYLFYISTCLRFIPKCLLTGKLLHINEMDIRFKFLLKILGCGVIISFLSLMEKADIIYKLSRGFPPFWADMGAVVTIVIIVYAHDKYIKK